MTYTGQYIGQIKTCGGGVISFKNLGERYTFTMSKDTLQLDFRENGNGFLTFGFKDILYLWKYYRGRTKIRRVL